MATKTITASVTLHVEGPAFKPFVFADSGIVKEGKYDVVEAVPGTSLTLDADEADRLIGLGLASEVAAPSAPAVDAKPAK